MSGNRTGTVTSDTASAFIERGIGRLLSRFQREFSPTQTLSDIVGQADHLREMTQILLNLSGRYPERTGAVLSVLSGLADLGVIFDMTSAVRETAALAEKMVAHPPVAYDAALVGDGPRDGQLSSLLQEEAQKFHMQASSGVTSPVGHGFSAGMSLGSSFVPGMSPDVKEKPGQWIAAREEPYCPPEESVFSDEIVCLHCGGAFSMLKRHIERQHRQSPDGYRAYWGLAQDYPMACESYSAMKKLEASKTGLGHYDRKKKKQA